MEEEVIIKLCKYKHTYCDNMYAENKITFAVTEVALAGHV